MGKIKIEVETIYDRGDVVVFKKGGVLQAGIITAYYFEDGDVWYNIAVSKDPAYSFRTTEDVGEVDICGKIEDENLIKAVEGIVENGQD